LDWKSREIELEELQGDIKDEKKSDKTIFKIQALRSFEFNMRFYSKISFPRQ